MFDVNHQISKTLVQMYGEGRLTHISLDMSEEEKSGRMSTVRRCRHRLSVPI